ncbi:MAG: AI-2E family transporter [Phototrophicales bacterium]|nr:MAG: AI-2E family transporter [Phototrophicales bacterium]
MASALIAFQLVRVFVATFYSVLWPLAVAAILALLLRPLSAFIQRKLRLNKVASIILLYFIVVTTVASIAAFILPVLLEQLLALISFQGDLFHDLWEQLRTSYPKVIAQLQHYVSIEEIKHMGQQALSGFRDVISKGLPAVKEAGALLSSALSWITGAAIIPVYLFYFLESDVNYSNKAKNELSFLKPSLREDIVFLANEFTGILVAFFRGQILIGVIMGILLAIGFSVAGLNFGFALGIMIGLLNIIPYLGTIVGLSITLPIAYFQPETGGLPLLGIVLSIFCIVQLIEGYLLTPNIMGKETGLHPMTIIVAIFFWGIALDGILGMILAIPLTAFFIIAWRLLRKKYLPMLTGHHQSS